MSLGVYAQECIMDIIDIIIDSNYSVYRYRFQIELHSSNATQKRMWTDGRQLCAVGLDGIWYIWYCSYCYSQTIINRSYNVINVVSYVCVCVFGVCVRCVGSEREV